jgi:hypothetical protein
MLVTVFVFLGIEGASVYSRYARRRQDVGRATVIGFVGVTALMVAVTMELFVAGLATFYTVFLVFAAGLDFLLLSFIIYTPGTILFVMSRREQNRQLFSRAELIIPVIAVAGFAAGIIALATGGITI